MASLTSDQYKVLWNAEGDLYLLYGLALRKSDLLKATLVALRKDTLTTIVSKVAGHMLPMELQMQIAEAVVAKDYENMPYLTANMKAFQEANLDILHEGLSEPLGGEQQPIESGLLLRGRMKAKLRDIETKLGASILRMTDLFPMRYESGKHDAIDIVFLSNLKCKEKRAGIVPNSDSLGNPSHPNLDGYVTNLFLWDHCYIRLLGLPEGQVRPRLIRVINQVKPVVLEQASQRWSANSSALRHPSFGDLIKLAMNIDKFQSQSSFIVVAKIHTCADCTESKREDPEQRSTENLCTEG